MDIHTPVINQKGVPITMKLLQYLCNTKCYAYLSKIVLYTIFSNKGGQTK